MKKKHLCFCFFSKHSAKKVQKSANILQQTCYHQADIRMRSHGLRQLVDDKSVASCQRTRCKLIVKTCYPQACCNLFQQVVTSVQMTSYNKPDFVVHKLQQAGKIDTLEQICAVFGCVWKHQERFFSMFLKGFPTSISLT